jgi:purine-nucleoside phosphorylase
MEKHHPDNFQRLFGQNPAQIQKTCLLVPFLTKDLLHSLSIDQIQKGKIYSSATVDHLTLIHTRMGASFVGDATLYLKETPCENLILFGSCGATRKSDGLSLGDLVIPQISYSMDNFSDILNKNYQIPKGYKPNSSLLKKFIKFIQPQEIPAVTCASFGSLKMERSYRKFFDKIVIDVLDMEAAAFFHAAHHIRRKAISFFYVSDILDDKDYLSEMTSNDHVKITKGIHQALDYILRFSQELNYSSS